MFVRNMNLLFCCYLFCELMCSCNDIEYGPCFFNLARFEMQYFHSMRQKFFSNNLNNFNPFGLILIAKLYSRNSSLNAAVKFHLRAIYRTWIWITLNYSVFLPGENDDSFLDLGWIVDEHLHPAWCVEGKGRSPDCKDTVRIPTKKWISIRCS